MKILFASAGAILILVLAGAAYQAVGMSRDRQRFPQRGRSFIADGVRLNLNCSGSGSPAVVFDAGMGGPGGLDWIKVQPGVSRFTRACSYDRAGYGWSDASPRPRTSLNIAKELKALLDAAGERGPYVMVGHSFGGYNVIVFTHAYPAEVAGVVLVDSENAREPSRLKEFRDSLPRLMRFRRRVKAKLEDLSNLVLDPVQLYLGMDRLRVAMGQTYSTDFPPELQQEDLYLEQQPKYLAAVEDEDRMDSTSAAQVKAAGNLGDRPLIVLAAGQTYGFDSSLTVEQNKRRSEISTRDLQAQYVHLSSRGKEIVVEGSSHEIPAEKPEAVVSAVREVWSAARGMR